MTKRKSTKSALLLSALSLLMCVSMFIGSTFAWFTDNVTSAGNIIKSGTLDVTMEWADGKTDPANTTWTNASVGAIFNCDKWEPGYTEVRHIKIANVGSLALKYQLSIEANGKVSDLADVIDVYYVDPAVQVADRVALANAPKLGTLSEVLNVISTTASGNLEAGEAHTVTLALKMQESAGNEYLNKSIGSDFKVKLSAIQLNYENDSFGPDYDDSLDPTVNYISTFDELKNAARNGGKVALNSDLHIADKSEFFYGSYVTAVYNDMILDLNGHSITIDVPTDKVADAPILFYVYAEGASLTIVGEGDIIAKNDAFVVFPRSVSEGAYIYGGNYYNIDDTSGTKNDINAIVYSQTNSNIHIYGGTFTFKNVNGHCGGFNVYDNSGAEIILYEGVLLSNSNYYKGNDADEIHLADGCKLNEVVIDGQTWYMVVKDGANVVGSATEFYDTTSNSGSVYLGADLNTSDSDKHYSGNREYAIRDGIEYTLNLNDHTINHDSTYQDGKNTGYTYLYTTAYEGKLTINGEGTINSANSEGCACIVYAQGPSEAIINGGNFNVNRGIAIWAGKDGKVTINGGSFISTGATDEELIYSSGGVIDIYGGFFHNTGWENRPVNVANANRSTGHINIYGGTFVNFDPTTGGDDPNNIKVADGYKVVSETQANGDVWYTVVAK